MANGIPRVLMPYRGAGTLRNVAAPGESCRFISSSNNRVVHKPQFRRGRQHVALGRITKEQLQSLHVLCIERIINVAAQVFANDLRSQAQLLRPGTRDFRDVFYAIVPGLLKDARDIGSIAEVLKSSFSNHPEGEDEGKVRPALPLFAQIIDVISFGSRLKRRIANQQSSIMPAQHLLEIGRLRSKSGI